MSNKLGLTFAVAAILLAISNFIYVVGDLRKETVRQSMISERNRVYLVERGAEDDAAELALSEHQEVNYVRCFLRAAGHVTCQVHTPPADVEAVCRARRDNELLVDGTRCRWVNPAAMAHPEVIRQ